MSEKYIEPEHIIGIPVPNEDELLAFERVLEADIHSENSLSLERIWQKSIELNRKINDIMQGSIISRIHELDYLEENKFDEHKQMVCEGFKLAYGLVMYTYFYRSGFNDFDEFLDYSKQSGLMPVVTIDEFIWVESLRTYETKREGVQDDNLEDFEIYSIAYRDSCEMRLSSEALCNVVADYREHSFSPFIDEESPIMNAQEQQDFLVVSFEYGYEEAIEMFIQTYEERALNKLKRDLPKSLLELVQALD